MRLSEGNFSTNLPGFRQIKVPEILQLHFAIPASYPINYSDQLRAERIARKHYDDQVRYIVEQYRAFFYNVCQERRVGR